MYRFRCGFLFPPEGFEMSMRTTRRRHARWVNHRDTRCIRTFLTDSDKIFRSDASPGAVRNGNSLSESHARGLETIHWELIRWRLNMGFEPHWEQRVLLWMGPWLHLTVPFESFSSFVPLVLLFFCCSFHFFEFRFNLSNIRMMSRVNQQKKTKHFQPWRWFHCLVREYLVPTLNCSIFNEFLSAVTIIVPATEWMEGSLMRSSLVEQAKVSWNETRANSGSSAGDKKRHFENVERAQPSPARWVSRQPSETAQVPMLKKLHFALTHLSRFGFQSNGNRWWR